MACRTEQEIRNNWDVALSTKECSYISSTIKRAFYLQDLIVLCAFHRKGIHCKKVENLLEDCGFYEGCNLLRNGKHDDFLRLILFEKFTLYFPI